VAVPLAACRENWATCGAAAAVGRFGRAEVRAGHDKQFEILVGPDEGVNHLHLRGRIDVRVHLARYQEQLRGAVPTLACDEHATELSKTPLGFRCAPLLRAIHVLPLRGSGRGERMLFHMHARGKDGYEPAPADGQGFRRVSIFDLASQCTPP
jgi:hypothetical protein